MKIPLLLLFTAGTILSSADAATITKSTSAPSSSYLSIAASNNNVRWQYTTSTNASSHRDVGQIVKIGSVNILFESLTIQVASHESATMVGAGIGNAVFSISIYEFADKSAVAPIGAALYSEEATLPASIAQLDYLTISLLTPYELQAGRYYGFVVALKDPAANQYLNLATAGTTSYDEGGMRRYENATANDPTQTWATSNGHLSIFIQATAIPEPHHYALLGVGAALLLWRKRKVRA